MSRPLFVSQPLDETVRDRRRRRGLISAVITGAVLVHLAGLVVATAVVVARFYSQPKATFEIPREIRIPVPDREHKMTLARHEAVAPKPTFNDRLVSTRPAAFSLPEMPKLDMDQLLPLDPSQIISDQVSSLVGSSGLGSGMGNGGAGIGGMGGTSLSFFGIKTEARRILLLFDVSGSVVNKAKASGVPLSRIKEETSELISKLPINCRYSIIQFVRNFKPFSEELVAASPTNKDLAHQWIETQWDESGMMPAGGQGVKSTIPNGLPFVLDYAFSLKPDTIFLISDGSFEQTTPTDGNRKVPGDEFEAQLKRLQSAAGKEVPIHFIGFQMRPEDNTTWRRLAQRSGGKFREMGR